MAETDPCTEAARLRALRTEIVTGAAASMIRDGDHEVRFYAADLAALDRRITEVERACAIAQGRPAPRRRWARGIRFC